jgi:hypothetical protein
MDIYGIFLLFTSPQTPLPGGEGLNSTSFLIPGDEANPLLTPGEGGRGMRFNRNGQGDEVSTHQNTFPCHFHFLFLPVNLICCL